MRILRSILCAGLAMMAVGLCAVMPAAAAVPIEVNAIVQPLTTKDYPVPAVAIVHQDVSILPSDLAALQGIERARSSVFASSRSFAVTPVFIAAYAHIDPDIGG